MTEQMNSRIAQDIPR